MNDVIISSEADLSTRTYVYNIKILLDQDALEALDITLLKNLTQVFTLNVPVDIQLSMLSTVFKSLREDGKLK